MKFWLQITFILIADLCWALEVPKDFEASPSLGETKLWVQPQTLETVSITDHKLMDFTESATEDALAEIKTTIEAKARTLSWILNIKNWRITQSTSNSKDGSKLILFFGSYNDSSNALTTFAEVYWLPKVGVPESYLFTRTKKSYSPNELAKRFKVQLP